MKVSRAGLVSTMRLVPLALACALAAVSAGCNSQDGAAEGKKPGSVKPASAPAKELTSAEEVLDAMAAAYQNAAAYSDKGRVRLLADTTESKIDETARLSVQFVRPNKLRLEAYQATVVIDGGKFQATIDDLPDQYVAKDAPAELSWNAMYADQLLAQAATRGFGGDAPQLPLLIEKDALRAILGDADKPVLAEPDQIAGHKCYRVKVRRPEGTSVFWIDQQTFVLRRFEYPTDELYHVLSRQSPVKSLSMMADFDDARLGDPPPPATWSFAPPKGAVAQPFFVPPAPSQLLGKKAPPYSFVDLQGNEVTPQSLAGKIVVLDFWGVQCGPCRQVLPTLDKVSQGYQGSNVVFLAVNVDPPETDPKELTDLFQKLNITIPIVRDTKNQLPKMFRTTGIPTTFIIDARGVVQDFESGPNPDLAVLLPEKLEKLRAGEDIFAKPLEEYEKGLRQYEKMIGLVAQGRTLEQAMAEVQETPKTAIAPRSEPRRLRLSRLWKSTDVKMPGNMIVLPGRQGAPTTIAVIDGCKGVTEIGLDGKLVARHPLLADDSPEVITMLRQATAKDGTRYLVAFAATQQRLHLIEENWKIAWNFPQDALENNHSGIADVQLGDLDADGRPEIYVGYFGVVGVQAVSLDGKRTAANRTVANAMRMAVSGPDSRGQRGLYCVNNAGPLVVFDARLERLGEVAVPDRGIGWIVSAELTGNPQPQWCGLFLPRLGETIAIGLDAGGREVWNYTLPEGLHEQPIEPVIAGRVTGNAGQWILPGCDGSIHILAADGQFLDRFHYGSVLAGLATAEVDSKPILVIASPDGVEALGVE